MLADVAERRVAQIVRQARGLNDLRIQPAKSGIVRLLCDQLLSQSPTDLSHLNCVLLARVEHVCLTGSHDLGDPCKSMKGR